MQAPRSCPDEAPQAAAAHAAREDGSFQAKRPCLAFHATASVMSQPQRPRRKAKGLAPVGVMLAGVTSDPVLVVYQDALISLHELLLRG